MPKERAHAPRQIVRIEHGKTLEDIPEPGLCSSCGAPQQREFLDWEEDAGWLVVTAGPVPGYGCTGCGLKEHLPSVGLQLMEEAAERFKTSGFKTKARQLHEQAERVRQALTSAIV